MKKRTTIYVCTACKAETKKWVGSCLSCDEWGTITEREEATPVKTGIRAPAAQRTLTALTDIPASSLTERFASGINEWDRVLGGGILPGSFLILTGDPGIGKSTLLLMVANALSARATVHYYSSEESLAQLKQRADRIGCASSALLLSDCAHLGDIIETSISQRPDLVILDSIQNCADTTESTAALRDAGHALLQFCKQQNIAVITTAHITKEGVMAGPKMLEHLADAVFYLKGEEHWNIRVLRSVKNRFGTTNEIGFFEMDERGLQPVDNINAYTISHTAPAPGAVITCSMEGNRLVLLELQALCVPTKYSLPQRVITGVDQKRVLLIVALLEKYLSLKLSQCDIFFSVTGGISSKESSNDLAIALALTSSYLQTPLPGKSLAFGELSLTGRIQSVKQSAQRIAQARAFGRTHIYTPATTGSQTPSPEGVYELSRLAEILTLFEG